MKIYPYFQLLQNNLSAYLNNTQKQALLQDHLEDLFITSSLDFDKVESLLNSLYSPHNHPHRDPKAMLRSLLLMTHHKITSIPKWVEHTRKQPLLAILSGFDPNDTPGVGTYYDFKKRLIDGVYHKPCSHFLKRSAFRLGKTKRSLKKDPLKKKDPLEPNQPQTETLVDDLLLDDPQPRPDDFYKLLEDLFFALALIPSFQQHLLPEKSLTVSGDGSPIESYASAHPKPLCACRKQGIYRCNCERLFTSPTAAWCHDSQSDSFVFGDRYYHLVTYHNGHDWPLLTLIPGGNESDYTLSLKALDRFQKACREHNLDLKVECFIGDGHHDTYAHYRYLSAKGIIPIIPLGENSQNALLQIEGISLNKDGVPLCPQGALMRHHQFVKKDFRHVYACPAKRLTRKEGQYLYRFDPKLCPIKQDCAPNTPQGPWVCIPAKDNPRLFPPIPRSTKRFQLLYDQRSATERKNNTKKNFYKLSRACYNADPMQIRLTLVDILDQALLWYRIAQENHSKEQILASCLQKIGLNGPDANPLAENSPTLVSNTV